MTLNQSKLSILAIYPNDNRLLKETKNEISSLDNMPILHPGANGN